MKNANAFGDYTIENVQVACQLMSDFNFVMSGPLDRFVRKEGANIICSSINQEVKKEGASYVVEFKMDSGVTCGVKAIAKDGFFSVICKGFDDMYVESFEKATAPVLRDFKKQLGFNTDFIGKLAE